MSASQMALALESAPSPDFAHFGAAATRVRGAMEMMGIAEEVLATLPRAEQVQAFRVLVPTPPLVGRAPWLYRAHAVELVARITKGEPVEPATDAELLSVMLVSALSAPLTSEALAIAEHLFERVAPPEQSAKVLDTRTRERWAGQVAEQVAKLRRKYRVEKRGVL